MGCLLYILGMAAWLLAANILLEVWQYFSLPPLWYYIVLGFGTWFVFFRETKEKQPKQSKQEVSPLNIDSWIQTAFDTVDSFASAVGQIKRTGHIVSPLTIEITSVDSVTATLSASFTVYGINTLPFYDLEMSSGIETGLYQPRFATGFVPVQLTPDMSEEMFHKLSSERHTALLSMCCDAIHQDLFHSKENYFKSKNIYSFEFDISTYPRGDVRISYNYISLKAENYLRAFKWLADTLRETYPNASVTQDSDTITVTF